MFALVAFIALMSQQPDKSAIPSIQREYWPSGQLKREAAVTQSADGAEVPDGVEATWREDGLIQSRREFRNGKLHGPIQEWHANGQLATDAAYADGKEAGLWQRWFDNGQVWCVGNYVDGRPDGEWNWFHPNGQSALSATFADGHQCGDWLYYRDTGELEKEVIWECTTTKSTLIQRFGTGELWCRGQYENWKAAGAWTWWHPNGQLALTAEFLNDQRHGTWTYYDDQGNITRQDRYDHGQIQRPTDPDTMSHDQGATASPADGPG